MPGPPRKNNHPLTGHCHNVKALARQQIIAANLRAAYMRLLPRNIPITTKNKKPLTSNEISGFWQG